MTNVFANLAGALGKLFTTEAKFRALDKNDIALLIKNNLETHQSVAYALSLLSDKEMSDWIRESVLPGMKSCTSSAKNVYPQYTKMLIGKAAQEERKRPLGALLAANQGYIKILTEIDKNLDKLVEEKSITMWNVRMSHLAVLGLLKQSDVVANFTAYLYAFMSRLASQTTGSIPKYREKYMLDNVDKVTKFVNDLLDKKGAYVFMRDIDTMKREQRDIVLGATGNLTGWSKGVNISRFSIGFLDALMSFLSWINIFSIALDAWDNYKLAKYEKNKEIKEWLEGHVALLRMDLEGMDKSSPQYTKMVNIIQAYDDKIAEYDEKINAFENEG